LHRHGAIKGAHDDEPVLLVLRELVLNSVDPTTSNVLDIDELDDARADDVLVGVVVEAVKDMEGVGVLTGTGMDPVTVGFAVLTHLHDVGQEDEMFPYTFTYVVPAAHEQFFVSAAHPDSSGVIAMSIT
jgi:hypothetical protein